MKQNAPAPSALPAFLDSVLNQYQRIEFLASDPLEYLHLCARRPDRDLWDQECVAVLSALLAYGNVKQIRASIAELLRRMDQGGGPARWVREVGGQAGSLAGFKHRFQTGTEMEALLVLLQRSWRDYGSLGAHFLSGDPELAQGVPGRTIERALTHLLADWKDWAKSDPRTRTLGFAHLLASPVGGSACKRWCMLLRWLGRSDQLDLGLWGPASGLFHGSEVSRGGGLRPAALIIPLDTHLARISRQLKLSRRKSADWKMALEVTARLRAMDPNDPIKYDFALCRLGMFSSRRLAASGRRQAHS
ncbi:MAG: TIGR02757 family protein [Bdellovibrionota bacterium]